MLPAKKIKPLTARQVDVLTKIVFGEIFCVEARQDRTSYGWKWNDCGVDATSVVRKLAQRKLIRRRIITIKFGPDDPRAPETTHYATPTPAGFAELEKHPAPWND